MDSFWKENPAGSEIFGNSSPGRKIFLKPPGRPVKAFSCKRHSHWEPYLLTITY